MLMKRILALLTTCALLAGIAAVATAQSPAAAPNGIELPDGYRDWRIIGISHRVDNNTLRIIFGNDIAVDAARAGTTRPWPDGAIIGKTVWKESTLPSWEKAVVPGEFVHAEFMVKDAERWRDTGGWGFARWKGRDQLPYGEDASFVQECFGCHTPVSDRDYVFTEPVILP